MLFTIAKYIVQCLYNVKRAPHVRRCRFNPILKVALTITLSWQDSKFYWKSWVNVVVWLISSTVGGYLNIMFPLLLLQIVKLTCTLDFDLNCIVSASR